LFDWFLYKMRGCETTQRTVCKNCVFSSGWFWWFFYTVWYYGQ